MPNKSNSYNKNKPSTRKNNSGSAFVRQFCAIVFSMFVAIAVCGVTLSVRLADSGQETPPHGLPEDDGGYGSSSSDSDSGEDAVTISPVTETDSPAPDTSGSESTAKSDTVTKQPDTTKKPDTTKTPVTTKKPDTAKPPVTTAKSPDTTARPPVTAAPPVTTGRPYNPPVGYDDPERPMTLPPFWPWTEDTGTEPEPPAPLPVRVAERESVDDSYFSDALFIGDSRTVGLSLYSGLKSNYWSQQGLNVSSVLTSSYISMGDKKVTLKEGLKADPRFTKVYISFGINEIGWPSAASFIKSYRAVVQTVREALPDAVIYVQEILPMSKATAENARYSAMGGNAKVAEYNSRLYTLCEEEGLYYIALTEVLADGNGDLNADDSFDGIHLGKTSCSTWVTYLKTHTLP